MTASVRKEMSKKSFLMANGKAATVVTLFQYSHCEKNQIPHKVCTVTYSKTSTLIMLPHYLGK